MNYFSTLLKKTVVFLILAGPIIISEIIRMLLKPSSEITTELGIYAGASAAIVFVSLLYVLIKKGVFFQPKRKKNIYVSLPLVIKIPLVFVAFSVLSIIMVIIYEATGNITSHTNGDFSDSFITIFHVAFILFFSGFAPLLLAEAYISTHYRNHIRYGTDEWKQLKKSKYLY